MRYLTFLVQIFDVWCVYFYCISIQIHPVTNTQKPTVLVVRARVEQLWNISSIGWWLILLTLMDPTARTVLGTWFLNQLVIYLTDFLRSSHCGSAVMSPTSIHEDTGLIPGLAQWVKGYRITVSCVVGCKCSSGPTFLWLCSRPAAVALIEPLPGNFHMLQVWPLKAKKTNPNKQTYFLSSI